MPRNLLLKTALLTGPSAALVLATTLCTPVHAASTPVAKNPFIIDFHSCKKPVYPEADLRAKHEGVVTLGFKLDEHGTVTDSKVVKSSGFAGLDEEARSAIAKCRFNAAEPGAKPEEWTLVKYDWSLK
jgi:TonB family protein